jgi:hypothetical protein
MDPIVVSALISAAATLVGVGGTVVVAIAGFRSTSKTNRDTINSVLEGQVTDRYTKAIEQLGSDKIDVRTGGIYALERIAHDSAKDHPVVMEMLTAFIREHSREQWPPPGHQGQTRRWTRRDVQAAVTVIGRRDAKHDIPGRSLDLYYANLTRASIVGANLRRAILRRVELTGADLSGAILAETDLIDVNLHDANLTGADLTGAKWTAGSPAPEGWKLDTGSGRLTRAQ